ncbi:MAG: FGGY family carbohydrate kinase [Flaviflexus sp.]|nr:FGGY family carbohydrate kinase [Flaviflexus sp.]
MVRKLVAGVDSSTQSCKIMIRDFETGELVRSGMARHASGTEISASVWWTAFKEAVKQAGGLKDVSALSVGGQQHGMVTLDRDGALVRNALLWNDTRSAPDAEDLIAELGGGNREEGAVRWAKKVGSVPVASLTVTKLRWLARKEPENLRRSAAMCLPHDYLTWRILGSDDLSDLVTDRSDASGTGYFSGVTNSYLEELLDLAGGDEATSLVLPRVLGPEESAGQAEFDGGSFVVGPGCGDNAGAALGLDLKPGELALSLGTSGVASIVSEFGTADETGMVTGFSDASGRFLPLSCTLNASRVLDTVAHLLRVDFDQLSKLALAAPPGAEGLTLVPYLEGERTPNRPEATGALHGVRLNNFTPENLARAAVEGMLCGVKAGVDAIGRLGVNVDRVYLIGGGSRSEAVCRIAPSILGMPVSVPESGEYVADGAARQAAWVLSGKDEAPQWIPRLTSEYECRAQPFIHERYQEVCDLFATRGQLSMEL